MTYGLNIRSCIVLKDAIAKTLLRTNIRVFICVYIQCRRRRPTDRLHLSFLFPAETDVLVPVFSQSTGVVVVNFVVVLEFPTDDDGYHIFPPEWRWFSREH